MAIKDRDDSIRRRITALLAIANGGSPYPEERDTALAQAQRLMLKHSIQMTAEDIKVSGAKPANEFLYVGSHYGMLKIGLMNNVYDVFGCQIVRMRRKDSEGNFVIHAFGMEADLAMAWELFFSLLQQMEDALYNTGETQGMTAVQKRSWILGFINRVVPRLRDHYKEVVEELGKGTDLVLVNRTDLVQSEVNSTYPDLVFRESKMRVDPNAHMLGDLAGNRADITLDDRKVRERNTLAVTS